EIADLRAVQAGHEAVHDGQRLFDHLGRARGLEIRQAARDELRLALEELRNDLLVDEHVVDREAELLAEAEALHLRPRLEEPHVVLGDLLAALLVDAAADELELDHAIEVTAIDPEPREELRDLDALSRPVRP